MRALLVLYMVKYLLQPAAVGWCLDLLPSVPPWKSSSARSIRNPWPHRGLRPVDRHLYREGLLIDEEIDRMHHAATYALLTRRDVIIMASGWYIYGIGAPEAYLDMKIDLAAGVEVRRDAVLCRLIEIQYERNDMDFSRGTFRVRGDVVKSPAYSGKRPCAWNGSATNRDHFRSGPPARQGAAQA